MKKLILLAAIAVGYSQISFGQSIEEKVAEETCKTLAKDKVKSDKDIADPKKNVKAATWYARGEVLLNISNFCLKTDSTAAISAYESFKKGLEVEPTSKSVKNINQVLSATDEGTKLYIALQNAGIKANDNKSYGIAEKCFALMSEVKKGDTTGYLYAGYMAQQLKKDADVVKYFEKAVEGGIINSYVYYMLSQTYKNEKQFDKAIAILKKGSEKNPNDKDLKGEIVNMNLASGNSDAVISDLKKLVESDPKNVGYLANLGIMLQNVNKFEEAQQYYNRVLALDPNNFDTNFNMGVYFFNDGVVLSQVANKMDMATYKKEGKAAELKACAKFNQALPLFEAAYKSKQDDESLNESMKNIKNILEKCSKIK